ncbi:hypothetical protein CLOM_g19449 [Closterium sp. NIES-68]|nr:hypothetical protein CLOM_g19449 [Closterium sp. NIES-68]GJP84971.1 hypothetical protein CLOP_g15014 [Closterium sp. NIES-67]
MGIVLGRINVETPQFTVEAKTDRFEIRRYPPQMAAEVTYDGDHQNGINKAFSALAGYIGALSTPQNRPATAKPDNEGEGATSEGGTSERVTTEGGSAQPQHIAMTAPVLTHTAGAAGGGSEEKKSGSGERIAMTAPVLTHTAGAAAAGGDSNTVTAAAGEKIAMTAPVVTASTAASTPGKTTMQFLLPAALTPASTPVPTNPAVQVLQLPPRLLAAVTFSGLTTHSVLEHKSQELRSALEAAGYRIGGDYVVGRYNPPFTLPFMRTNEILYPVEE